MKLKLIKRQPIVRGVETFTFEPDEPVSWQPGQYMHYVLPHSGEDNRGEERWFTISSPPFQGNIAITTRFTDDKGSSFKKALRNLKAGATIQADGPKGSFVIDNFDKKYVLIAGGIGITPYHSMLLQFDHDGRMPEIELLYANNDGEYVFGDELDKLAAKHSELNIRKFTGRRITKTDLSPYAKLTRAIFYISGPEPMVENYAEVLKQMGLPEDSIKTDFFPGY